MDDSLKRIAALVTGRIHVTDRLLMMALEPQLAEIGITLAEFRVVGQLLGSDEGLSQAELARRLHVKAPTLSVALRNLENKGVIERVTDPIDARVKRVRASASIPRMPAILETLEAMEARATRGLSKSDLATTRNTLEQIIRNLSE